MTGRAIMIGIGAVVLVGGGALLASARPTGSSEPRDLSRALAALERQQQALERLQRQSDVGPRTVVVTAPGAPETLAAQAAPAAPVVPPPEPPPEPSAEQLEAEGAARAVVERAIASGRWGDAELSSFREQFSRLTRAQQGSVLKGISAAINEGRFHLDPARLPL